MVYGSIYKEPYLFRFLIFIKCVRASLYNSRRTENIVRRSNKQKADTCRKALISSALSGGYFLFFYNAFKEVCFLNEGVSVNSEGFDFVLADIIPEAVIKELAHKVAL